ncbi:ABC transporter ATP-binding protein [Pelosinus sp. IPA-1]|uniref:ABC transporter ATP-binding protein n=1 Tax=Pelosinus sp. IPA-1 TaxID=3029569 RepID=UPI0024361D25|nr:ABC transporter ATP-binding protein [Pelosinus sp. IPA-1]GMB01259.1 teichoic acid ABC transporter ATP-binding protein [Pelosinus sp. IPA-1]
MDKDVAIKVENISKIYKLYNSPKDRLKESIHPFNKRYSRDFYALNNVSMEVKKGETVGIIGRNGSGKSTLLKIITGVLTPTYGNVTVNGRISALLELGTGFNQELSGIDNVYFSGTINGFSKEEMDERIDDILAFADIGDFVYQPVKSYSSGMFVRLAFAVAINVQPDVFIVDEALSVGDAQFQKKCLNAFYKLRDNGCSILFVSHETYAVRNICQRALYLKNGEKILFGSSAEVVDKYVYELEQTETIENNNPKEEVEAIESQKGETSCSEVREEEENINLEREYVDSPQTIGDTPDVIIEEVHLLDKDSKEINQVVSGQDMYLRFSYKVIGQIDTKISFVFNIYRHNGFYVCGTTTLMDGLEPFEPNKNGTVTVYFPKVRLLSGHYKCRVAVNDDRGLGVYAEAVPVCEFRVVDRFEAVGLINLERSWIIKE